MFFSCSAMESRFQRTEAGQRPGESMSNTKVGRNDPCPCGSGKKYKHCCLGHGRSAASELGREFEEMLAGHEFESLEEVQALADSFMAERNRAPVEDFCGLSPEQMGALLYAPLESPEVVRFPDRLSTAPQAPAMTLLNLLLDAIGEQGLKTTAKGNLPRALCIEAAAVLKAEDVNGMTWLRYSRVNKEEDFPELFVARHAAQYAGLIRKHKGRFLLTRQCRTRLDKGGAAAVYPPLLRACATRFNWAWRDRYPELPFIQQSFAFVLYLLSRFGDEERSNHFYEDAYLRAFPMLVDEVAGDPYFSAEDVVKRAFTTRALERFAWFVGLLDMRPTGSMLEPNEFRLSKTALLDEAVVFPNLQSEMGTE